jgi:hypothetical protein
MEPSPSYNFEFFTWVGVHRAAVQVNEENSLAIEPVASHDVSVPDAIYPGRHFTWTTSVVKPVIESGAALSEFGTEV